MDDAAKIGVSPLCHERSIQVYGSDKTKVVARRFVRRSGRARFISADGGVEHAKNSYYLSMKTSISVAFRFSPHSSVLQSVVLYVVARGWACFVYITLSH